MAQWISDWGNEPHVWDPDIFALGDFNADQIINPDGSVNPVYQPFADTLTIPQKMHAFENHLRGGKDKHDDQITWYENGPGGFSLDYAECGYFDIDTVLRPGFDMTARVLQLPHL